MIFGLVIGLLAAILGWRLLSLSPSASKKTANYLGSGQMFDSIASYYDITNKFMSLGIYFTSLRFFHFTSLFYTVFLMFSVRNGR